MINFPTYAPSGEPRKHLVLASYDVVAMRKSFPVSLLFRSSDPPIFDSSSVFPIFGSSVAVPIPFPPVLIQPQQEKF